MKKAIWGTVGGFLTLAAVVSIAIGAHNYFAKESEVSAKFEETRSLVADSLKSVNQSIQQVNSRITLERLKDDQRYIRNQMRDMEQRYGVEEARGKPEYRCLQDDLEEIKQEIIRYKVDK